MNNPVKIGEAEWLSPGQVSRIFGVPRSTLYDWINRGHIRSSSFRERHQRHGKRLIHVQSVRDYIEAHVVEPSADVPIVETPALVGERPVTFKSFKNTPVEVDLSRIEFLISNPFLELETEL